MSNIWHDISPKRISPSKFMAVIEIPATYNGVEVTQILSDGFKELTSLKTIIFSNNITHINKNAFYGCIGLENLNLPESVTKIDDYSFYGCSSISDVSIPSNVTYIGKYAFYDSGISKFAVDTTKNWKLSTFKAVYLGMSYDLTGKNNSTEVLEFTYVADIDMTTLKGQKLLANMLKGEYNYDFEYSYNETRTYKMHLYQSEWTCE